MASVSVAFFDLDLTLISVNSASLWIRREVRLGHLSRWQAARGAWWIGLYQLGIANMEDAIRQAVQTLAGEVEADLERRTNEFWDQEVVDTIRPGARSTVESHRKRGDHLVLLTSSSNYLGGAAARDMNLDDVLSNRFAVRDGVLTGDVIDPVCYGTGKLVEAKEYLRKTDQSLAEATFYTDSYSDLPLLEKVGTPVAVHPDPRLARAARRRGWAVVDWR